jgi:hypothetical protein
LPFFIKKFVCHICTTAATFKKKEFDKALHASLIPHKDSSWIDIEGVIDLFHFKNMINWFEYTNPPTF